MSNKIHPSAVVHKSAILGEGVEIGPFCVIGEHVKIGAGNSLASHVVIDGHTEIGDNNKIHPFAALGQAPQDLKYKGETTYLKIGSGNTIREYVTIHCGTTTGHTTTIVGNHNLFMVGTHVAHDCTLGNNIIMANGASLGGHTIVEDSAVIGALVGIHQFVRIGKLAMIAALAGIPLDVPPFCVAAGDRAKLFGLNRVGIQRSGISKEATEALRKAYRIIFQSATNLDDALKKVKEEYGSFAEVKHLVDFIEKSERGVLR